MNAKELAAAFERGERIIIGPPSEASDPGPLSDEERAVVEALRYHYDNTTGRYECYVCGKNVKMSGHLDEVGFMENVAPDAASGGTMRQVHRQCSRTLKQSFAAGDADKESK